MQTILHTVYQLSATWGIQFHFCSFYSRSQIFITNEAIQSFLSPIFLFLYANHHHLFQVQSCLWWGYDHLRSSFSSFHQRQHVLNYHWVSYHMVIVRDILMALVFGAKWITIVILVFSLFTISFIICWK